MIRKLVFLGAALPATGLGATLAIGQIVATQAGALEAALAENPDVEVHEIRYERGLLGGTLHYDLALAALPDPELPGESLRITGADAIHHWGWVDGIPAAAYLEKDWRLPPEARAYFIEGEPPALSIRMTTSLAGQTRGALRASAYRGTVEDPESGERGADRA